MTNPNEDRIYAAVAGVKFEQDSYDFGHGVVLSRTYAHFTAPNLLAFGRPPSPGKPHGAPWRAARGGLGLDIVAELSVPISTPLDNKFDAREVVWLIAVLCRIYKTATLMVPFISDHSFGAVKELDLESEFEPNELEPRILYPKDEEYLHLDDGTLGWVRRKWVGAGMLMADNPVLYTAVKAFDSSSVRGRLSSSLLTLWGALEQLFSPSRVELRFRVASFIAAYFEPKGESRLQLYKRVLKLYDQRSVAAHSAKDIDTEHFLQTYRILKDTLGLIIEENHIPSKDYLEELLLGSRENQSGRS